MEGHSSGDHIHAEITQGLLDIHTNEEKSFLIVDLRVLSQTAADIVVDVTYKGYVARSSQRLLAFQPGAKVDRYPTCSC